MGTTAKDTPSDPIHPDRRGRAGRKEGEGEVFLNSLGRRMGVDPTISFWSSAMSMPERSGSPSYAQGRIVQGTNDARITTARRDRRYGVTCLDENRACRFFITLLVFSRTAARGVRERARATHRSARVGGRAHVLLELGHVVIAVDLFNLGSHRAWWWDVSWLPVRVTVQPQTFQGKKRSLFFGLLARVMNS